MDFRLLLRLVSPSRMTDTTFRQQTIEFIGTDGDLAACALIRANPQRRHVARFGKNPDNQAWV